MKEITFIIILTFLNLVSTAQRNDGQIERFTIAYKGDSTLFTEKYEIDIVKKKVFSITPIMNYLDIKGTKYRTHIKFNRQSWTELTDLINRIDFSKLDSTDKKNIKSPGKRSGFLLTCCFNARVSVSYSRARSKSSITFLPRMKKILCTMLSSLKRTSFFID